MRDRFFILSVLLVLVCSDTQAALERVWLSFSKEDASQLCVQWETSTPVKSQLKWKAENALGTLLKEDAEVRTHRMEVPFDQRGGVYRYQLWDGEAWTPIETIKALPSDVLKLAMVGDWGFAPRRNMEALVKDDPHVLLTLGDNVVNLHAPGKVGVDAYRALMDEYPQIFRRIPFMPILGNHDHEVRPRGHVKYPPEAVYDTEAKTFREFFALPGKEWIWELHFADFDLRFLSLALHHLSDFGTTWQTAPAWDEASEQFQWFKDRIQKHDSGITITLINENIRFADRSAHAFWKNAFMQTDAVITGFGYFGERTQIDQRLPYYNTCLKGDGDVYPHPQSQFLTREDHYLWVTIEKGIPKLTVEFRQLATGKTLESSVLKPRELK